MTRCIATCADGQQCIRDALDGRRPRQCRQHLLLSQARGFLSLRLWRCYMDYPANRRAEESEPQWILHFAHVIQQARRRTAEALARP